MLRHTRTLLKSQSGNTGIMFALTALPLLLGAGAAVDMVRANQAQVVLQAAVDAAALSAAATQRSNLGENAVEEGFYKKDPKEIVEDFIKASHISQTVDIDGGVETKLDSTSGTLTVNIKGKMKTSLMKLAGIETLDIDASAQVGLSSQALEVALVLDNTGSMKGQKLVDLKSAALSLVSLLHEKSGGSNHLKIGVVPYSEYVNVGMTPPGGGWLESNVVPSGSVWQGCVGSRSGENEASDEVNGSSKYPMVGGVNCVTELLPLTSDRNAVESKINALKANGYTYIPAGLLWGWHVLSEEAPFKEGLKKKELEEIGGSKAIVLMTDGANTISSNGAFHNKFSSAGANKMTATLCKNAKADDIKIFTVAFQVDDDEIKNLLKACASAPEMAFDADNAHELGVAFSQIGGKLADLYLTK